MKNYTLILLLILTFGCNRNPRNITSPQSEAVAESNAVEDSFETKTSKSILTALSQKDSDGLCVTP